jgi:hypothetical protein
MHGLGWNCHHGSKKTYCTCIYCLLNLKWTSSILFRAWASNKTLDTLCGAHRHKTVLKRRGNTKKRLPAWLGELCVTAGKKHLKQEELQK